MMCVFFAAEEDEDDVMRGGGELLELYTSVCQQI